MPGPTRSSSSSTAATGRRSTTSPTRATSASISPRAASRPGTSSTGASATPAAATPAASRTSPGRSRTFTRSRGATRSTLGAVAAFGHSAGGHLALLAGARRALELRAVVSAAGVVDLEATDRRGDDKGLITRFLGGGREQLPERWHEASPRERLPLGLRQLLAVGDADVHYQPNLAYAELARAAGDEVEVLAFAGAGHFELVDPETSEWKAIRERLEQLLA